MGLSTTHLIMLLAVIILLFGRNKISDLMGDVGKGIRSFQKGIAEEPASERSDTPIASASAERKSV